MLGADGQGRRRGDPVLPPAGDPQSCRRCPDHRVHPDRRRSRFARPEVLEPGAVPQHRRFKPGKVLAVKIGTRSKISTVK